MNNVFRESLKEVKPIRFREPLAETLGALKDNEAVLDYSFIDVVKMAGHACPTVASAYLCCQTAVEKLYGDTVPVRGEIAVTVYGEPDEGVYGVMAQVFSFLTGAAPITGFRGLGPRFKRKDLLQFRSEKIDPEAMCFEFRRLDNGEAVLVRLYPQRIPFPVEKEKQLSQLLQPVIWEAATEEEKRQFQGLWMEKVEHMLLKREEMEKWLKLEERRK
ncbi:MAG: hypothetical protein Q8O55_06740 [Dehalococcoidales bacterium]|nr:hypothetical protein [Dehalococcoidales bacterium]